MNSLKLDSSTVIIDKQIKKINSMKLELKGFFLTKDYQNLTMLSTQELNYLDNFLSGPELVKLCLKTKKCKKILTATRKLKNFWMHNDKTHSKFYERPKKNAQKYDEIVDF